MPHEFLRPILPPPRQLAVDEVRADGDGHPLVEPRLVLLDCRLTMEEIEEEYPDLCRYLRLGLYENLRPGIV